jgi:hypothetical protein
MNRLTRKRIQKVEDKTESKNSKLSYFINNGLLLALLPGYAYLLAFAYEYGYCEHFDLPIFLISPSLSSILIIISVLLLFILSNLKFLGLITPLFRILNNPKYISYYPFIRINTFFLVAFLIIFIIYRINWEILTPLLIGWAFYTIIYFAPVWFFNRKKKSLQERFDDYNKHEDKLDLLVYFSRFINPKLINYSLLAVLVIALAYFLGNGEAYKQEEFYVLDNDTSVVVLRSYNDLLICSNIDFEKKIIRKSYSIINLKSVNKLKMKQVKIGLLSISEEIFQEPVSIDSLKVDSTKSFLKNDTIK